MPNKHKIGLLKFSEYPNTPGTPRDSYTPLGHFAGHFRIPMGHLGIPRDTCPRALKLYGVLVTFAPPSALLTCTHLFNCAQIFLLPPPADGEYRSLHWLGCGKGIQMYSVADVSVALRSFADMRYPGDARLEAGNCVATPLLTGPFVSAMEWNMQGGKVGCPSGCFT